MKKCQNGFTAIDVLITVGIVGILASVAYPSYVSQMQKTHRAEAATELAALAQAQERFYAQFRTYTSVVKSPEDCAGADCGLGWQSDNTENDFYRLTANGNDNLYMLTATAHGSQVKDSDCQALSINNTGIKSARNSAGQDTTEKCW